MSFNILLYFTKQQIKNQKKTKCKIWYFQKYNKTKIKMQYCFYQNLKI